MTKYWLGKKRDNKTIEKMRQAKLKNPTKYWLGKKRDKETISKISLSKKGKHCSINTEFKKGSSGFKGKHTEESKRKMSLTKLIKNGRTEPLKEDRRNDPAYKTWRRKLYRRDDFKCRINNSDCKGRLEAHHILGWKHYPELRYEINNGITLCHAHHPRSRAKEAELSPYFQELVAEMK